MSKIPLIGFVAILILALITYFWWQNTTAPANPQDTTQKPFLITRGESLQSVASKLEKEGFIKDDLAFRVFVQLQGKQKDIKAGNYRLSPSLSLSQVVSLLIAGPKELWVTYPEGLRREEILDKTVKGLGMDQASAVKFASEFMAESRGLEGQLFPDTYLFAPDVTSDVVVSKMKNTFDARITDQMREDTKKNGLTFSQTLVLASIVERETKSGEERPIVAGILLKRLDAGWALQADATLQYIVAKKCEIMQVVYYYDKCDWWRMPTSVDKQIRSPYNTYLNKGLPPSPIANPGLSAIKAAIYPEESEYWFYLHGSDGQIRYARNAEEHAENVRKYL